MGFAARRQASVEGDQGLVPTEGCGQRGCVEGTAQASPSAGDVPLAFVLATVIVEWREAGQRSSFFAAHAAELRHANDEGQRGSLADAGDAQHEIEAPGEIVMGAQLPNDAQHLGGAPRLQARDVGHDETP